MDDADDIIVRPELVALDAAARARVLEKISQKGGHCGCCGAKDFDIGDTLYLGFLFLDEDTDAYIVALTCRNPDCAKPRTAIILPEKDFLTDEKARAASWSAGSPGTA